MHDFTFKKEELYCEDVPVSRIVEACGTPAYIYSHSTILSHFKKIEAAFKPVNPLICFSMKANSSLAVCRLLAKAGSGFDIVSGGELYRALKVKVSPKKIVYASVGKTPEEIKEAIRAGILCFNVESIPELETIEAVARKVKKRARIALRLNPDVDAHTHRFITTGTKENKFGMGPEDVFQTFLHAGDYPHLDFVGIHLHIGSQILETGPYVQAIECALQVVERIKAAKIPRLTVEYLNIGGGFGIIYKDEEAQTADDFARAVIPLLASSGLKIILEPGRFIVGNAGIMVTRVLYVKKAATKTFVIVDAGMNDLIRPALYGAYHEILPLKQRSASSTAMDAVMVADIVGPVCESGDFLAKDRRLPRVEAGEYLAVMGAGAYGFVMASNYNSRLKPCEVMVFKGRYAVVRKRERYQELIKNEVIPSKLQ
ncbi:MAG: diaminopimelate decarboxylase [Candidatus Omnitrophica bacterium]|nr:diaminopimelate decarboxylase [Candidatus Omnitrophota bacterium]